LSAADRGDLKNALRIFTALAKAGDAKAQYVLALMYEEGQGTAEDQSAAVSWVRRAAEQGYAPAQNNLACALSEGRGVRQDHAAAFAWFLKAAQQGDAHACCNLAGCYEDGEGVARDDVSALAWYALAEQQGDASAGTKRAALAKTVSLGIAAAAEQLASDLKGDWAKPTD